MRQVQALLKWMTAGALLVCLCLLAWQCIDIYLTGKTVSTDTAFDLEHQMYRWVDVRERLGNLSLPFVCTVLLSAVSACMCGVENKSAKRQGRNTHYQRPNAKTSPVVRSVLLVVALVFILLGVINGGLRDVLVKAINICTECIGLG